MGKGGESLGGEPIEHSIVTDDTRFAPFLDDQFNVAQFTSRVLAGSHTTAQAQSEQLAEGVRILETELANEVVTRSGDLILNVRRMGHAESSLQDVVLSVSTLQSAVHRIRGEATMHGSDA